MTTYKKISNICKCLIALTCAACMAALLCGCTISHTTKHDTNEKEKLAKPIAEEFLKSISSDYTVSGLTMLKGKPAGMASYTASYTSDYVAVGGTIDGRDYQMFVNAATGQIWWDYYSDLVRDLVREQISPICAEFGINSELVIKYVKYQLSEFYKEGEIDLEITIDNCLPSEYTPDNFKEMVPEFLDAVKISDMTIAYSDPGREKFCADIMNEFLLTYYPSSYEDAGIHLSFTAVNVSEGSLEVIKNNPKVLFSDIEISEEFKGYRHIDSDRMLWKCTYNDGEEKTYSFNH